MKLLDYCVNASRRLPHFDNRTNESVAFFSPLLTTASSGTSTGHRLSWLYLFPACLLLLGLLSNLSHGQETSKSNRQERESSKNSAPADKKSESQLSPSAAGEDARRVEVDNNLLARQLALAFSHPGVEKELDLVAYQKEQLRDLFYDYQKTLSELAQRFARMKQEDRSQLVGELVGKVDAELEKILLPQQRKRLRQISLQSVVPANNQGLAPFYAVLGNASYCEHLGISGETASRLQAKLREENEKFRAEVDRLRAASLERVLDTLTSAEREALTEGLGTAFDFGGYELGRGGVFRNADDK
ncbi:MAG: hypothetical protein ACK56J_17265 [Planctomycetota bacterium]|jgi:DNA-directed RNA polymerase subunit F